MASSDDLKIRYESKDLPEIIKEFEERGGNTGDVMAVVAEEIAERVDFNFKAQMGFKQGPWPKRAMTKIRAYLYDQGYRGHPLLRDTGVLAGSIMPSSDEQSAEVYTNVPYAIYHVSKAPRTKIPLRDFLDIDYDGLTDFTTELILAELTGT